MMRIFEKVFEQSQPLQCAQRLMRVHGYEHVVGDLFGLDIDDQHTVLINVQSRRQFPSRTDTPDSLSLAFSVARRDINEFLIEHDTDSRRAESGWRRGTLIHSRFFEPPHFWQSEVPFDAVVDEIDAAVAGFVEWADLSRIEAELYGESASVFYGWAAIANSALNGDRRGEDLWERFMTKQVRDKQPLRARADTFYENTQAFNEEHPNGVARNCT